MVVCLANPKSVLFFTSIFATFTGLGAPTWIHIGAIAIVVIESLAFYTAVAWLFSGSPTAAVSGRARKPVDRLAAAIMAGFGVELLWGLN